MSCIKINIPFTPIAFPMAALPVTQQAIATLIHWADLPLPATCSLQPIVPDGPIAQALHLTKWDPTAPLTPLRLIFDETHLTEKPTQPHYHPIVAIADHLPPIPYPLTEAQASQHHPAQIQTLKTQIRTEVLPLLQDNWENLPLLTLILEKYTACLSSNHTSIALIDHVRITSAIATALSKQSNPDRLSLIAGDLSGIQNFIYTISSEGALKSLRARSFYLELVTEELVQQLLLALDLPRHNIIYAGGGNLYLLAPADNTPETIDRLHTTLNNWLHRQFQGKIYLALTQVSFPTPDLTSPDFVNHWNAAIQNLNRQKSAKFSTHLETLFTPRQSHDPCRVCHRDDIETLKPLKADSDVLTCATCRSMFELGGRLFQVEAIVRSTDKTLSQKPMTFHVSETEKIYYHFFPEWKQILPPDSTVLLVNDWNLEHYQFKNFKNALPLLLGNYSRASHLEESPSLMSVQELAQQSQGVNRIGYLRMDVDRLGQLFARGLGENYSLAKLAGLSRQMSYFFKVYLNSLAHDRHSNFSQHESTFQFRSLTHSPRQNLLFIYAGGDDLFVAGAWNELIEFAFDTYQAFRAYTGQHPDITLSGGISLVSPKFPLYQAASTSGKAESAAKENDRDSLGLFGEVFKWRDWLGTDRPALKPDDYLQGESHPKLHGVLPFVENLLTLQTDLNTSRSFVRNLLVVADLRDQRIREAQKKAPHQVQDISHFLHLPKLAYTLARLPKQIRDHPDFIPIRQSFMSPHNSPYFRAIATWIELLNRKSS
jgi:CRISPR-associated protein Csm1